MKPKADTTKLATEKLEENKKMGYPGYSLSSKVAEAILVLDHYFGEGYAKAHPDLLGSCIQALAVDQLIFGNISDALESVSTAIDYLAKNFETK